MKKICIIYSSSRKNGNSDKLENEFARGAKEKNCIEEIFIRDLNMHGCLGCEYCYEHSGNCIQMDDMQKLYSVLEVTDLIVFVTPIYYQAFPSQLKAFIDRLYVMENRKFNIRSAILLATYASCEKEMSKLTIDYYKSLLKYHNWKNEGIICISGLDEKDDILNNNLLEDAFKLGKSI